MKINIHKIIILTLTALAATTTSWGQHIVGMHVPTDLCAGESEQLVIGHSPAHNVEIYQPIVSLGHSDRIFLPDGQSCGSLGCSYQSPVTFTAFQPGATVNSVNDIRYVRLNIEHSWIGDIYIGITCPNGQTASLMNYSDNGSSNCTNSIPDEAKGWNTTGGTVYVGTYLGLAYDHSGYPACDSTVSGNAPGVGWNYCWSDNTDQGYSYASGDGRIYRNGHAHNGRIDSSNVNAGTNFYHPDNNFNSLIGCPLNGEWQIEVMDGWSQDNGYVFEWELALSSEQTYQTSCQLVSRSVIGPYITRVDDSTFTLDVPGDLQCDTAVTYTFRITNSCGDTIDTVAVINFHPTYHFTGDTVVCDTFMLGNHAYTSSTVISNNGLSTFGCDSTVSLDLTVLRSSRFSATLSLVENALPYTIGGIDFYNPVEDTVIMLQNAAGCDSTIHFTLQVWPNTETWVDSTVCQSDLPVVWNGISFTHPGSDTASLYTSHGADSVVYMTLYVLPVTDTTISVEVTEALLPAQFLGLDFYDDIDTTFVLTNTVGCDSLVNYHLHVLRTRYYYYSRSICDNILPLSWLGVEFTQADSVVRTLFDSQGADSVVTLVLTVYPTYDTSIADRTCDNIGYTFNDQFLNATGVYDFLLSTSHGCDSMVHLDLTVNHHNEQHFYDTVCYRTNYLFDGQYYSVGGTHIHTYTNVDGCDSLLVLHLGILRENFQARIKASRTVVTPLDLEVELHDVSLHNTDRNWMLPDNSNSSLTSLSYTYPQEIDSVDIGLVAYSIQGCTDTAHLTLLIDRSILFTPNIFTPSLETNNRWQPVTTDISSLEIWLYNRQGNLVAHWDVIDGSWDGLDLNGDPCPQGAYVYKMEYRSRVRFDRLQVKTGTVCLLR